MNTQNDGGPAFPHTFSTGQSCEDFAGMSLRAWLAGKAMQGDWAQGEGFATDTPDALFMKRSLAYLRAADALIAALESKP